MSNSKLLALVKELTLSEKRDLKVFAQMPSNKLMSRDKIALEQLLSLNAQALKKPEKIIWAKLFAEETAAEQNRVKTRLFQMMEKYISLQQLDQNQGVKLLLQTGFHEGRKINKIASLSFNRSKKLLNDKHDFDQKVFLFWLYQQAILREKDVRRMDENIETMEHCLDEFYACNKLRILCERANRQKILKKAESTRALAVEADFLQTHIHSDLVRAYCNLFQLIASGNEADFISVKDFVDQQQSKLKREHLQEFIAYMMNYCIRKFNTGDLSYASHYLVFIEKLENEDLLLVGGSLGIGRLKNTIHSLLLVQGAEAAQAFKDKYGSYLEEAHQPYLLLAQATIDVDKNLPQKALAAIKEFQDSPVYLHDVYYKITCDKLMLKCYYELQEFVALLSKIDGIKAFLNSGRRLPKKRAEKGLHFLNTIERLTKKGHVQIRENDFTIHDYRWLIKVLGDHR